MGAARAEQKFGREIGKTRHREGRTLRSERDARGEQFNRSRQQTERCTLGRRRRGAVNLLDPATVFAATRVCSTGKVYDLGLPVQRQGVPWFDYRGAPQRLTLTGADRAR